MLDVLFTAGCWPAVLLAIGPLSWNPDSAHPSLPNAGTADAPVRLDGHGDALPPRGVARLGSKRLRHGNQVLACTFSSDDDTLISADRDGAIGIWDASTGKEVRFLSGRPGATVHLALSPYGRFAAYAPANHLIRVEDMSGRGVLWQVDVGPQKVSEIGFSEEGKLLIALYSNGETRLWRTATGQLACVLSPKGTSSGEEGRWRFAPLCARGLLATSHNFGRIQVWNLRTHKLLQRFGTSNGSDCPLAFSPDGSRLATFGEDNRVHLWEVPSGRDLGPLGKPQNIVHLMRFSPDGRKLATGSTVVTIWSVDTRRQIEVPISNSQSPITAMAFSKDGGTLAVGREDHTVWMIDVQHLRCLGSCSPDASPEVCARFLKEPGAVVSSSEQDALQFWTAIPGQEPRARNRGRGTLRCLSGDGRLLLGRDQGGVIVEDLSCQKVVCRLTAARRDSSLLPAAIAWNGRMVATTCIAETPPGGAIMVPPQVAVELWSGESGRRLSQLGYYSTWEALFRFAPGDRALVGLFQDDFAETAGAGDTNKVSRARGWRLRIWDVRRCRQVTESGLSSGTVGAVAFSPSGRIIACTENAGNPIIRLREVLTGQEIGQVNCKADFLGGMAFVGSTRLLAFGDIQGTIHLWDLDRNQECGCLVGHRGRINSLDVSPDGRRMVSGSQDTTIIIWDVTELAEPGRRKKEEIGQEQLESLWNELASSDARRAYRAVCSLSRTGDSGAQFIGDRIRLGSSIDGGRINSLIQLLESQRFVERERATKELGRLGELGEPALRGTLAQRPAPETQRRIENILTTALSEPVPAELVRAVRAVDVLERISTPKARQLLRELAETSPFSRVKEEAKASLDRLPEPTSQRAPPSRPAS